MALLLGIVFASHAALALDPPTLADAVVQAAADASGATEAATPTPSPDLPPERPALPPNRWFTASLNGFTGEGHFGGGVSVGWSPRLVGALDFDLRLGLVVAQDTAGGANLFPNGGVGLKVVFHEDGYITAGMDLIFHPAVSAGVFLGKTCFIEGRLIAMLDGEPQYLIEGLSFGVALPRRE
jgi:hypothetical protein